MEKFAINQKQWKHIEPNNPLNLSRLAQTRRYNSVVILASCHNDIDSNTVNFNPSRKERRRRRNYILASPRINCTEMLVSNSCVTAINQSKQPAVTDRHLITVSQLTRSRTRPTRQRTCQISNQINI